MTVEKHRESVEGEDDGGHDDADHGEHGDDPRPNGGVRLLEQVPHLLLELPDLARGEVVLLFSK